MSDVAAATFGGVPAWLLRAYLQELGGAEQPDGAVQGPGWTARLEPLAGGAESLRIGRVTVTIEGPAAVATMAALRAKAQRGGG
jgi:hypothetical protein